MIKNPRVSFGVPVYNGGRFLEKTLDSLLDQSFTEFEIVICDNASTDNTKEICLAYASNDPRVRYYRSDVNRGAAWNHNRAFRLSKGVYFKWNSADDLCDREFLSQCVAALDREPAAVMAVSQPIEIDELGNPLSSISVVNQTLIADVPEEAPTHIRFRQNIRLDHLCLSIYSLIRSEVLRQTVLIGNYPDSDRVLLARLALFGRCIVLPGGLFFNRDHQDRFTRYYNGQRIRERATWFDPANAARRVYPAWKELGEFCRVIGMVPLHLSEKLRCYREIARWLWNKKNMRLLYIDAVYYPRKWVVETFPAAKVAWRRFRKDTSVVGIE